MANTDTPNSVSHKIQKSLTTTLESVAKKGRKSSGFAVLFQKISKQNKSLPAQRNNNKIKRLLFSSARVNKV